MVKKESPVAADPAHALTELAKQVGKPDPKLLAGLVAGTTDAQLVDLGKTIDTRRIITDASRIYGEAWAYWQGASALQRKLLRGVSAQLLAIAVHKAVELEALRASIQDEGVVESAERAETEGNAGRVSGGALNLRDQAYDALRDAAGQDAGLRDAVKKANGTAENAGALASGLEGLAGVVSAWLKRKDAALAARLELASLDAAYAEELTAAAKDVRAKDAARTPGKRSKLNQGALDREDGLNILLLGQVLRGFDAAHARNPIIPRLQPLATRRLFNRRGTKAAADVSAPGDGADAGAGKGGK